MKVFRDAFRAGKWAPNSVAAIGKFDALHIGHQRVIRLAVARARALAVKCLVVTFDPHPQELFAPGTYRPVMTTYERARLFEEMGVDALVLLPFDRHLACMAPDAFVKDILCRALRVLDIYIGEDFCFGKDRAGRVPDLQDFGGREGFLVHPVRIARRDGQKVSTSRIRSLLAQGKRSQAAALLGRPLPPESGSRT